MLHINPFLTVDVMIKKNLYNDADYEEILGRIDRLSPESKAEWGEMTVGQMLAHCAEVAEVAGGKELRNTPFYIKAIGGLIKKTILSDKPYPKSTKTHPQYIKTDPHEFAAEKTRLLACLEHLRAQGPITVKHPLVGEMTGEERGWAQYKHLDHHLTQFGA